MADPIYELVSQLPATTSPAAGDKLVINKFAGGSAYNTSLVDYSDLRSALFASPTFTGTITAAAANFSGVIGNANAQLTTWKDTAGSSIRVIGLGSDNNAYVGTLDSPTTNGNLFVLVKGSQVGTFSNTGINSTNIGATTRGTGAFTAAGIGMDAVNPLDITSSQNAIARGKILNSNVGTSTQAGWELSNGTTFTGLYHTGTAYTTGGIFRQDGTYLYGSGTGGVSIISGLNQPVYIAVNSTQVGTFTGTGLNSTNIGATTPGTVAATTVTGYVSANSFQIVGGVRNDQAGSGTAAWGLNVSSGGASDTSVYKAGIGLTRANTQGVGTFALYNRTSTDTSSFGTGDKVLSFDGNAANAALFSSSVAITTLLYLGTYTVATLPAAPTAGATAYVTDANATTYNSTVAGGGANGLKVTYNGSAWKIG